jgi:hypothetical protein
MTRYNAASQESTGTFLDVEYRLHTGNSTKESSETADSRDIKKREQ